MKKKLDIERSYGNINMARLATEKADISTALPSTYFERYYERY